MSNLPVAHTSFTNTGTVSWSDIGAKSVAFSGEVLSRIAAAGVSPHTIAVGQTVAQTFRLSRQGRQNIQKALSNLKGFNSWNNVLWFGFGVKSIIYDLTQTDEGSCLVGICGALSECYDAVYAADVLQEMVQTMNPPQSLRPSTREWKHVVNTCVGVFTTSGFPLFLGLLNSSARRLILDQRGADLEKRPEPADVAAVLMAMGQVTRKDHESIRVEGGHAGVWILAIAHWLFGLTVTMISNEGVISYSTCNASEEPQITYITRTKGSMPGRDLQLTSSTYILRVGWHGALTSVSIPGDIGRIQWRNALSSTFQSSFQILREIPDLVGTVIGCLKTWYRGITHIENYQSYHERVSQSEFLHFSNYEDGFGTIGDQIEDGIKLWFPELEVSHISKESASASARADASALFQKACADIKARCPCASCCLPRGGDYRTHDCVERVLLFVIKLALFLSNVQMPEDLFPTRKGLRRAFLEQRSIPCHETLLKHWHEDLSITVQISRHIELAITLFANGIYRDNFKRNVAAARGGICVYFGILQSLSSEIRAITRLHIVPGCIELNHRLRYDVRDLHQQPALIAYAPSQPVPPPLLVVREGLDTLEVAYRLTYPDDSVSTVPCVDFIHNVLRIYNHSMVLQCSQNECQTVVSEGSTHAGMILKNISIGVHEQDDTIHLRVLGERSSGGSSHTLRSCSVWIYSGNDLGRCGIITTARKRGSTPNSGALCVHTMFTGTACIQCCLRQICHLPLKSDMPNEVVVLVR